MTDGKKAQEPGLNIVAVGHVDHGKSTVIGRLLHDTGSLPLGTIEKVRRIAKETGKPFEYAYLLDAFEEEQQQGITIDTTQIQFATARREYVIIDAPGHKEFLKNMISGAANASAALLVVDAAQGVQEQSKRHGYMLSLLGIKQVYVLVNKMDLAGYEQKAFEQVAADMKDFLGALGLSPLRYIPVSGFCGDNITTSSENMPWYQGPCLLDALDLLESRGDIQQRPLRLPIQDVYKFDERRIIAGRIEAGSLKAGDEIAIYPGGRRTKVEAFAFWQEKDRRESASAGESVGIQVKDEFFNQRGELITLASAPAPKVSSRLRASVFWMGREPLAPRKKYKLKLATQAVEAELESIEKIIDASDLGSCTDARAVALNDVAEVVLRLRSEIAFDLFQDSPASGRFVLVDGYDVAGGGIVLAAESASAEAAPAFLGEKASAHGDIFDEFYYDVESRDFTKVAASKHAPYHVGDSLPLKGLSYSYPQDFDMLVLRDQAAVEVRKGKIASIKPLEAYTYQHFPLVNGRGFGLKIESSQKLKEFLRDHQALKRQAPEQKAAFANQWYELERYRRLKFYFDYVI